MATDNDTSFDAALAALDVEPTHHTDRMVTTYDILGLDAVRAAHRAEVDALRDKLTRVLGAIQRLQPTGSPIPGDEVVLAEWIVGEAISARAAHRAEVERAVADKEGAEGANILNRNAVRAAHRAEVERAVAEEREACVAACHGIAFKGTRGNESTVVHVVNECAKAIRARGAKS